MVIPLKGMVCRHCIRAVEAALKTAAIAGAQVALGEAVVPDGTVTPEKLAILDRELAAGGFARITDADTRLVEQVKQIVIAHIRNADSTDSGANLSTVITRQLPVDYSTVSRIFSAVEGRTIEKFAILQRIEYVKELLAYRELTISEIAYRTGYSSAAHLSRQFKQVTGLTPTDYLRSPLPRLSLDTL